MTTRKHASTLLILMVASFAGLANAQTSIVTKAQVPFDFVVNGKTIPAGQCVIRLLDNVLTQLMISNGNQHYIVHAIENQAPNASKGIAMVFHRYSNRFC